jgi:uncharacterized protein (UPF0261 family)
MTFVGLFGTLDTKGQEYGWIRDRLTSQGIRVILVDTGVLGEPVVRADIAREEVAHAAGTTLAQLERQGDRGTAVAAMARGAAETARRLHREGRLHGILSVGGSGNSTISSAAMRALPLGVPKLLVSSMTSGDISPYIGTSDITMMYSVVDIAGLNRISRAVFANAADAIAGMATGYAERSGTSDPRPLIGATMLGVTTPAVDAARHRLTELGYEVLVFHATGTGDRTMESMAASFAGILDLTLIELANDLVAQNAKAGPSRLEAGVRAGIPMVVAPGALDMVKFGPTVPDRFRHRHVWVHNASVTVISTTARERATLGEQIAAKLRHAIAPTAVYLPHGGLSTLSTPGGPYHDPAADAALFHALRTHLQNTPVEIHELPTSLADPAFGFSTADHLHTLIQRHSRLRTKNYRTHAEALSPR